MTTQQHITTKSCEHNSSSILQCDFNLFEMAQMLLNMDSNAHTKKLSEVTHVRVTPNGDVQFVIKPIEKFLGDTVVNFTRNNWFSYVTVARHRIQEAMKKGIDDTFRYHANTKVARVLGRENGKYSVHLLTYTMKGNVRTDLCVYLNEEEYAELEKSVGQINQWIETIVPAKKKSVLKGYVWKLNAHDPDEQNEVKECHEVFYKREHAVNMGIKTGYKYLGISTELQI